MDPAPPRHEQDEFWEIVEATIFTSERRATATTQVDGALALLTPAPGARILDLACGVGRHSLELARRGFRVTGVDRTQRYLDEAVGRAAEDGLAVEFVRADMRQFVRPGAFDAAVNFFTSFGYFADPAEDRRTVANAHASLREGAAFLIDVMGKEVLARIFRERDWTEHEDGTLELQERRVDPGSSWVRNRWILVRDGERREVHLEHRVYSAAELTALLLECGFADVAVFGGLDARPYDVDALRLVAMGRK